VSDSGDGDQRYGGKAHGRSPVRSAPFGRVELGTLEAFLP
jgi:hypothetical protein